MAEKKICTVCRHEKNLSEFYLASNPATSSDGRKVNVCRDCYKKGSKNDDGTINLDGFKEMLHLMDKPFDEGVLDSAIVSSNTPAKNNAKKGDVLSEYMRMISSLPQYKGIGFIQSMKNTFEKEAENSIDDNLSKDDNHIETTVDESWDEKDIQNKKYSISTIGYDPFCDMNLTIKDKKNCFNVLASYCDGDGIRQDGHKMQCVIQMATMHNQCKRFDEMINLELSKKNPDCKLISSLVSSKTDLQSSIQKMAQDNNISSKFNKNSKPGQDSLSSKMKEMEKAGFDDIKVNLFDIKTCAAFKQIADLSNSSIMEQISLLNDDNEKKNIIQEQRDKIVTLDDEVLRLKEENRLLQNKIIDLEIKSGGGA